MRGRCRHAGRLESPPAPKFRSYEVEILVHALAAAEVLRARCYFFVSAMDVAIGSSSTLNVLNSTLGSGSRTACRLRLFCYRNTFGTLIQISGHSRGILAPILILALASIHKAPCSIRTLSTQFSLRYFRLSLFFNCSSAQSGSQALCPRLAMLCNAVVQLLNTRSGEQNARLEQEVRVSR